jgi:hypothetical protein
MDIHDDMDVADAGLGQGYPVIDTATGVAYLFFSS